MNSRFSMLLPALPTSWHHSLLLLLFLARLLLRKWAWFRAFLARSMGLCFLVRSVEQRPRLMRDILEELLFFMLWIVCWTWKWYSFLLIIFSHVQQNIIRCFMRAPLSRFQKHFIHINYGLRNGPFTTFWLCKLICGNCSVGVYYHCHPIASSVIKATCLDLFLSSFLSIHTATYPIFISSYSSLPIRF